MGSGPMLVFLRVSAVRRGGGPVKFGCRPLGYGSVHSCLAPACYMVRWGSVVGPLFQFGDGSVSDSFPFCGSRAVCVAAGGALLLICMCQYSGHSFGIGAELCGIQDSLIKTLGQWQSLYCVCADPVGGSVGRGKPSLCVALG